MNRIFLRALEASAVIGVYADERKASQRLLLDLDITLPHATACHSDRLEDTIDYAQITTRVREVLAEGRFALLEAAAEGVAHTLISEFAVPWLRVSVAKPDILPGVGMLGAVIERNSTPIPQLPE